jgi:hypothetical protein
MKKNIRNIGIAFTIGALCRYIFFRLYGSLWASSVRHSFTEYLIDLFPKSFGPTVFLIQILFETSIVAFVSIIVPAFLFGYNTIESKKQYRFLSVSSFAGIICFDLFYYSLIIKNFSLLLDNYLPVWHGIIMIFIWIFLFYWIFSFGKYLRSIRNTENPAGHA